MATHVHCLLASVTLFNQLKHMKKILLLFSTLVLGYMTFAQCTPDTNMTGFLSPSKLPDATAGKKYDVFLSLRVPKDSTIVYNGSPVNVSVDSAHVAAIKNVPSGFSWVCNRPTCTWAGGNIGCAVLTGTPDSSHLRKYEIWVYVVTYFKIIGITNPPYFTRVDSSSIDLNIIGGANGLDDVAGKNIAFKMFPNPASKRASLLLDRTYADNAELMIFDLAGKLVQSNTMRLSQYESELDISNLPKGMYLLNLKSERSGNGFAKLLIE